MLVGAPDGTCITIVATVTKINLPTLRREIIYESNFRDFREFLPNPRQISGFFVVFQN